MIRPQFELNLPVGREPGQGGLIAVAVTIMVVLVIAGAGLANMSYQNARQNVASKVSLQTYYAAQAGIQEAIGSRMIARSNYMNFYDPPGPVRPYFNTSGEVRQNPNDPNTLIGIYRYVILGGDGARDAAGNYYDQNDLVPASTKGRLVATDTLSNENPFYVVSNGMTCRTANSRIDPTQTRLQINRNDPDVPISCSNGGILEDLTIVAEVHMDSETPGRPDEVRRTVVFNDRTQVRLPNGGRARIPGVPGWSGGPFDFDAVWAHDDNNETPVRLMKVVFYDFSEDANKITKIVDVPNGGVVNWPAVAGSGPNGGPVDPKSVVRLYFDGPIDYRSIDDTYDPNLGSCKTVASITAGLCNIRLFDNNNGTYTNAMTMIPHFPGNTQVLLYPPFEGVTTTEYELQVDARQMRSFSNAPGRVNYRITFRVN